MSRELEDRLRALEDLVDGLRSDLDRLQEAVNSEVLSEVLRSLRDRDARRNRSSPTTRDMTDADARSVLTGPQAELGHKDAARVLGLTYSQVYSCRLGHTFKHVHKELRGTWRNPWAR